MGRYFFLIFLAATYLMPASGQHVYTFYNTSNSDLPDNTIRCITPVGDSVLWVGTEWGMAKVVNGSYTIYQQSNSPLPDNAIRCVEVDRAGHVWIGTANGGLTVISDTGWHTFNTGNSPLPNDHVKAVAFDTSGYVWIGTVGGVAGITDTGWVQYNMTTAPFDVDNTGSIYIAPDDTKWFGTVNGGLLRLREGVWTKFRNNNSTLPDNTILDMAPDSAGNIWMCMPAGGAAFYTGSFNLFNTLNSNLNSNSLRSVAVGSTGKVYFASVDKGIQQFSGGNAWKEYSTMNSADTNNVYLNSDDLLCVAFDSKNYLWAGTSADGLVRIEFLPDTVTHSNALLLPEIQVYPNPVVNELYIDGLPLAATVSVWSASGTQVYHTVAYKPEIKLPFDTQPKGNYFVIIGYDATKVAYTITRQ